MESMGGRSMGLMELMEPRITDGVDGEDSRLFDSYRPPRLGPRPAPLLPLIYSGHSQQRPDTPEKPSMPRDPRRHQQDPSESSTFLAARRRSQHQRIRSGHSRYGSRTQHAPNTHLSAVAAALSSASLGPDAAVYHLTAWDCWIPAHSVLSLACSAVCLGVRCGMDAPCPCREMHIRGCWLLLAAAGCCGTQPRNRHRAATSQGHGSC